MIGTALTFFAVNIWLAQSLYPLPEQKTQLAHALSAVGLVWGLPLVVGAPIAGAWADRHDRRRTMIVANLLSATVGATIVALMIANLLTLPVLLALLAVYFLSGAFHAASFDTSYAMLVPQEQLPRANGMMQSIWALSGLLSPGLAAGLISLPALARQGRIPGPPGATLARLDQGVPLALGVDVVSFLIATVVLVALVIPTPKRDDLGADGRPKVSLLADVRRGWLYIWHRRPMLWLLGTFAVVNLFGSPAAVLQPLLVKFSLAADWKARGFTFETALALLATAQGFGGIAGGVAISVWGGLKAKRVLGVLVPLAFAGLFEMIYGLSPWIWLSTAMVFVMGAFLPAINAHSQSIWQAQVPRELQGRVFSVRRLIAQCTFPIGTVIGGWLGGVMNPGTAIAILGGIMTLFGLAQLMNPILLRVEDKAYLDALAAPHERMPQAAAAGE
jgi:MFS family permease